MVSRTQRSLSVAVNGGARGQAAVGLSASEGSDFFRLPSTSAVGEAQGKGEREK